MRVRSPVRRSSPSLATLLLVATSVSATLSVGGCGADDVAPPAGSAQSTTATTATSSGTGGSGAGGGGGGGSDPGCVPDSEFFAKQIWAPILSQDCIPCHNPLGEAKASKMVLHSASEAGYLDANFQIVKDVASFEKEGTSILLLKPSGQIEHGGNEVIPEGGSKYAALAELLARIAEPAPCQPDPSAFFDGIVLLTPEQTLRKASLALAGRLPLPAEEGAVKASGDAALPAILDALMKEDAFFERIREIYNDRFLTDSYDGGTTSTDIAAAALGTSTQWYQGIFDPASIAHYGAVSAQDLQQKLLERTNLAISREPLDLIAHVVKNDRPFGEVLTADYVPMNPYSAKAYGVAGLPFADDTDVADIQEGQIAGIPHAGVLTTMVFLVRHTTTLTNRNRHRARFVYEHFLGTDILKTGEQPIDPTQVVDFNPTMNNPSCSICHSNVDPIAGAFHSFSGTAVYDPNDAWFSDMRQPGFGSEVVPFEEFPTSLQWLAARIADDPRFALSAVYVAFQGFTGQAPLVAPSDPADATFDPRFEAYLAQYEVFDDIAAQYASHGENFKEIVKAIVLSPYFRASNAEALSAERAIEVADVGMGRLLLPEQLARKIEAVLGYPWRTRPTDEDVLLAPYTFELYYGGIDSTTVTTRITEPNGVLVNVANRMANEMSCAAVPRDLSLPAAQRILLPDVEVGFTPEDANGFPVDSSIAAIKKNIQHLHARILGESLAVDHPEIVRTYQLFYDTWKEGQALVAAGDADYPDKLNFTCRSLKDFWTGVSLPLAQQVEDDPGYTVRAWMAVVTYMLSDYAFLYE